MKYAYLIINSIKYNHSITISDSYIKTTHCIYFLIKDNLYVQGLVFDLENGNDDKFINCKKMVLSIKDTEIVLSIVMNFNYILILTTTGLFFCAMDPVGTSIFNTKLNEITKVNVVDNIISIAGGWDCCLILTTDCLWYYGTGNLKIKIEL